MYEECMKKTTEYWSNYYQVLKILCQSIYRHHVLTIKQEIQITMEQNSSVVIFIYM